MRLLRSAPALTISLLLYPRIVSLHDLPAQACFPDSKTQRLVIPSSLRASYSRIQEGGAYLVSDGQITLLWLHSHVSPALLEDLFGPGHTTLQSLPADMNQLPILQTHLNAQVRNLLAYWSSCIGSRKQTIQLARQGLDGAEYEFARLLVEDRNAEAQSYVDWLVHVHRGVQLDLSGQRRKGQTAAEKEEGEQTIANLRAMGW
jgi:protein transport protein SEC24